MNDMGKNTAATEAIEDLLDLERRIGTDITSRLDEFRRVGETASEEELFRELVFCLLTPQSKARSCWKAASSMGREELMECEEEVISEQLRSKVRFHRTKAKRVVEARALFVSDDELKVREIIMSDEPAGVREWLIDHVKGLGYKEASHFLRNIGLGGGLAILDRHILRNMVKLGVIEEYPKSLTPIRYIQIEGELRRFSEEVGISMDRLDLLLWYMNTGEIFK